MDQKAEQIMMERFGGDAVVALATVDEKMPYVRYVNAHYERGAFYVITHALSTKMCQIECNPTVAIAGEWLTAHGNAVSLGWFGKEENHAIAEKLRIAFSEWIDNGHNDFEDRNTIILRIKLTDGVLLSHGTRYDLRPGQEA